MKSEIIYRYFPDLTEKQKEQFERLEGLYTEWNAQINVISRKDIDMLYERHVLHSLGIAKVCRFADDSEVLDVGTGGGFPGIPLAILFPEVSFHLVDAVGKKIKVVEEVAAGLGLTNVKARMGPFLGWVQNKINRNHFSSLDNGILYLKGGDLGEEMKEVRRKFRIYDLKDYFQEEFFDTKKVVYIPF